jgi:hypothetical protein
MKIYSGKCDMFGFEANDCAVRCLANLSGMSYHEAHTELRRAGRQTRQETEFDVYYPLYRRSGIHMISIHGFSEEAVYLGENLTSVQHDENHLTVGECLSMLDKNGSYAILTKDHIFAYVKDVIYDKSAIGNFEAAQKDEVIGIMEVFH